MDVTFILVLVCIIAALAVACGWYALRQTKGTERGSPPGKGNHVIDVNYNSGGGGGTQATSYTIPKDPQEYAKRFVPRGKKTEK